MKYLILAAALSLPFIPQQATADEAYLGLKTYHFDRGGSDCLNEEHHLAAYKKNDITVGTYENSQCMRSYLVSKSYTLGNGFGVDMSVVTGYPKAMHIVKGLVLIPMVTYTRYWGSIGIKAIMVPTVLVGVGIAVRF